MTTATPAKTLPSHGTGARYQRGCHCRPCTNAVSRGIELRRLDRLRGNPRKVPAQPLIPHLGMLREADMSWGQIAHAARTSHSTPREIFIGKSTRVLRDTAVRLLAVRPNRPQIGFVSALGAGRRLQALYALAHGHRLLVQHSGVSSDAIENLLAFRQVTVSVGVDSAVRRTYAALSMTVGSSHKTRARARREGWAPPLAWDDIDDPLCVADLGQAVPRPLAVAEDVAFLEALGLDRDRIAERLDLGSWNSVEKNLARAAELTAAAPP